MDELHLVERESSGRHSDQDIEEVKYQLRLRVQGQREDRRGSVGAYDPHLTLP